jgi:hypothetical protein
MWAAMKSVIFYFHSGAGHLYVKQIASVKRAQRQVQFSLIVA